ncbi:MAG: ABC transporter substrate-binding protein, partial [Bacteroidetes bacterium HGW-Bacteroidetes-23]
MFPFVSISQNLLWEGYFSYNEVRDLSESENRLFAACETALFSKNRSTNEIKTFNTVDGLSGETISTIYHSQQINRTFVGHDNGLLIMINEATEEITLLVGIRDQAGGIPPNKKKINHIYEYNSKLYISTDFAVVEFKLTDFTFGDTFYISPTGAQAEVLETTVLNEEIYAVTLNHGIRNAPLSNPNLVNFQAWQTFDTGFWRGIVTFNEQLVAINSNNIIYRFIGTSPSAVLNVGQAFLDLRSRGDKLIATTATRVVVMNESFSQIAVIQSTSVPDLTSNFTSATIIGDSIYIGTFENG